MTDEQTPPFDSLAGRMVRADYPDWDWLIEQVAALEAKLAEARDEAEQSEPQWRTDPENQPNQWDDPVTEAAEIARLRKRSSTMHRRAQKAEGIALKWPDRMEWQNEELKRLRKKLDIILGNPPNTDGEKDG